MSGAAGKLQDLERARRVEPFDVGGVDRVRLLRPLPPRVARRALSSLDRSPFMLNTVQVPPTSSTDAPPRSTIAEGGIGSAIAAD